MGDLEFHYQKVEEARQEGYDNGFKEATEKKESEDGDLDIFWLILFAFMGIALLCIFGSGNNTTPPQNNSNNNYTAVEATTVYVNETRFPDLDEFISNNATRFYKYIGSDGVVYVRHHYEPNDQLSRQGYYKSDTGEYILLVMSFYPQNDNWICNWRVDHAINGQQQTLSKGADAVYDVAVSSENCVNALVQALTNYGYDSSVLTTDGTEITPSEGRRIICG